MNSVLIYLLDQEDLHKGHAKYNSQANNTSSCHLFKDPQIQSLWPTRHAKIRTHGVKHFIACFVSICWRLYADVENATCNMQTSWKPYISLFVSKPETMYFCLLYPQYLPHSSLRPTTCLLTLCPTFPCCYY